MRSAIRGILFLLACCAIAFALVRGLPRLGFLPRPASTIVSYGSLRAFAPAENVALYALAIACAVVAASLLLRPAVRSDAAAARGWPPAATAFALCVLAAIAVNASWLDPAGPMVDCFHEGEFLAYRPAFLSGGLSQAMIIHGPGIDLGSSLLAARVHPGAVIASVRLLRTLQGLVFWCGFLWGTWELLSFAPRLPRWANLTLLVACAVPLAASGFTPEMTRKAMLAVQFALVARTARREVPAVFAAVLGASLPLGVFYNYLEGLAGIALVTVAAILLFLQRRPRTVAIAAGSALGVSAIAAAVAGRALSAMGAHVAYWARNGQLIWGKPLRDNLAIVLLGVFGPLVALQAAALLRLWRVRRRSGSWIGAALDEAALVVALALSLSSARSWLDRADDQHLELAGWVSIPLLLVLVRPALAGLFERRWARFAAGALVAAAPIAGLAGFAATSPWLAAQRLVRAVPESATPDAALMAQSYRDSIRALAAELGPGDCFFTLTSEGVWYHLLDRPSCSRFHQVVYARSDQAQAEVAGDLERRRPPVILFSNEDWWNHVDGVPLSATNHPVYAYVLSRYRPWRRIGEHWFWKRGVGAMKKAGQRSVGGAMAGAVETQPGVAHVSGSVDEPIRLVYLESGDGLLSAVAEAAGGRWSADVPASALPALRAYGYDADRDVLVPFSTVPEPPSAQACADAGHCHG